MLVLRKFIRRAVLQGEALETPPPCLFSPISERGWGWDQREVGREAEQNSETPVVRSLLTYVGMIKE